MLRNTWPLSFMRPASAGGGASSGTGPYSSSRWRINISETQVTTNFTAIAEIEFLDELDADMAIGGTASASASGGSNPASNAFDDSSATSWSSGTATNPQWIEYNFGAAKSPNKVRLTCTSTIGDAPRDFTIEYYDGANWQIAKTVSGLVWRTSGQVSEFPIGSTFTASQATFWRLLHGMRQSNSAFPAWAELQFRGTTGGADLTDTNRAIYSQQSGTDTAAKAFDDNTATKWSANGSVNGSWIGNELASASAIEEVVATSSGTASDSIKSFNVQFWNSEYWETYWSVVTSNWGATETRTFNRTDAYSYPTLFNSSATFANNNNSSTPPTISIPSGADVDDIALLEIILADNVDSNTINTPSGWTQIEQQQITSGQNAHALFYKRLTLSDIDGSVTPTTSASLDSVDTFAGMISLWRHAYAGGTPYEGKANNSGTGTAMGGAAVTTTGSNRKIVHFGSCIGQQFCSPAAGYTEEYDVQTSSGTPDGSLKLYSKDLASAGTESAANHTLAGSRSWQTIALALIPA